MDCFACARNDGAGAVMEPVIAWGKNRTAPKILFIIFVDAMFTTLFECLFTKVFDVIGQS
jgi:hypothetical protein